jgi:hypothetical protein
MGASRAQQDSSRTWAKVTLLVEVLRGVSSLLLLLLLLLLLVLLVPLRVSLSAAGEYHSVNLSTTGL